jgi:hypothetical protein
MGKDDRESGEQSQCERRTSGEALECAGIGDAGHVAALALASARCWCIVFQKWVAPAVLLSSSAFSVPIFKLARVGVSNSFLLHLCECVYATARMKLDRGGCDERWEQSDGTSEGEPG